MRSLLLIALLVPVSCFAAGPEFKAGLGRVDITPDGPIWMAGYGNRNHPSDGVLMKLWAKALAVEDAKHNRLVIVTTDLIGLPRAITDEVSARVQQKWGIDRAGLLFNSSHTHTGPLIRANLVTMFDLSAAETARVNDYSRKLTDQLVDVIGAAVGDLAPAEISYGFGSAPFAINRRQSTPTGVKIGLNPTGPMDHTAPVLRVTSADGKLRAILFAYACHNTTLTGQFYQISGDYAGYAQAELEAAHPGATAMFMLLCGGDQNPNPRSSLDMVKLHGHELATEVERVLASPLKHAAGPLHMAYKVTQLNFAPHTRETFEEELNDKNMAKVRLAKAMLKDYDQGHPVRSTPYPVQALRFDRDLTILALGGEVVIDYDLRVKKEYGPKNDLIVAGYSNDVMCYIASARVLKEGGYEALDSMWFYGQPGSFADDVEDRIFDAIHQVLKRVGLNPVSDKHK